MIGKMYWRDRNILRRARTFEISIKDTIRNVTDYIYIYNITYGVYVFLITKYMSSLFTNFSSTLWVRSIVYVAGHLVRDKY